MTTKAPEAGAPKEPETTQPQNDDPKAAPQAGSEQDPKKAGEQKEPETVDLVKANRERLGRAKDTAAGKEQPGSKASGSDKAQSGADAEEAGKEPDLEKKDDDEKSGDEEETFEFSEEDLKKPGFFDGLTKRQWEVLDQKYPAVAALVRAGKREAQGYIESAKKKAGSQPQTDPKKPASAASEASPDLAEAIDMLYDEKTRKDGLQRLLAHPDSKEILRDVFNEFAREISEPDPALQPLTDGIVRAAKEYPLIQTDQTFFDEVHEVLQRDPEAYEDLMHSTSPRLIAAALENAAASVTRSRAARKPKAEAASERQVGKRREDLERNTEAAKEQAGVKAPGGSRPSVTGGEPENTVELVTSIRKAKNYQHIGK